MTIYITAGRRCCPAQKQDCCLCATAVVSTHCWQNLLCNCLCMAIVLLFDQLFDSWSLFYEKSSLLTNITKMDL